MGGTSRPDSHNAHGSTRRERRLVHEGRRRSPDGLETLAGRPDAGHIESELQKICWQASNEESVPLLVTVYRRDGTILLSLMYLAHADGYPLPSSEVKGIVLLEKEESLICAASRSLLESI